MAESVVVRQTLNEVTVSSPGPQGPRGKTILNGSGIPSSNLGLTGDFYVNNTTHEFYGPKLNDLNWTGATIIGLSAAGADYAFRYSWELAQITKTDIAPIVYSVVILHNLGFYPNVTVKTSAGDILETGIDYDNTNQITLTMAQPFSGTAHLS
jgi:hypothetical protein